MQKHYLFPLNFDKETEQDRVTKFASSLSIADREIKQKSPQENGGPAYLPWSLREMKNFDETVEVRFKEGQIPPAQNQLGGENNTLSEAMQNGGQVEKSEDEVALEPEIMFTSEDVKEAHELGYNDGYEDGLKEGAEKVEAIKKSLHEEMLERLSGDMAQAIDHHDAAMRSYDETLLALIGQIMRRFMPGLLEKHGDAEILHVVKSALFNIKGAHRLTFSMHPEHKEGLEDDIVKLAARRQKDVVIDFYYDATMAKSDVMIDWGKGAMARDSEAVLKSINQAIEHITPNHSLEDSQNIRAAGKTLQNETQNNETQNNETQSDNMNDDMNELDAATHNKGDQINHG